MPASDRYQPHAGSDDTSLDSTPRRSVSTAIAFIATCAVALGISFVITGLQPNYYDEHPIDFAAIEDDQYALISALTDAEIAQVKLDYIERAEPPRIAVYGHHIVRGLGQDGLPASASPEDFFNFYLTHLTLAETRDVLRFKEKRGKLPTDLILVHVSHPYFGAHLVVGNSWEMPLDFYWQSMIYSKTNWIEKIDFLIRQHFFRLSLRLDWKHIGYALINVLYDGCQIYGVYDFENPVRESEPPSFLGIFRLLGLDYLVSKLEAVHKVHCVVETPSGFLNDGSFFGPGADPSNFDADARKDFSGNSARRAWTGEVVEDIRDLAREIQDITERNGIRAVFFLAPRLQKFVPNAGHEHADQLVAELKKDGIVTLDYRRDLDETYFSDGIHLNSAFLRTLLADLAEQDVETLAHTR